MVRQHYVYLYTLDLFICAEMSSRESFISISNYTRALSLVNFGSFIKKRTPKQFKYFKNFHATHRRDYLLRKLPLMVIHASRQ